MGRGVTLSSFNSVLQKKPYDIDAALLGSVAAGVVEADCGATSWGVAGKTICCPEARPPQKLSATRHETKMGGCNRSAIVIKVVESVFRY